jgi:hypothetical protein
VANELQIATTSSGLVAYAILRNAVGQPYNVATLAFQDYVTANLANYVISLAEQGTATATAPSFRSSVKR